MITQLPHSRDIARLERKTTRRLKFYTWAASISMGAALLALSLLFTGCGTTPVGGLATPQYVHDTIGDGIELGLIFYPDALPDVRKATTVVCDVANATTNLSRIDPSNLTDAMAAAGLTNKNARAIVSGAIFIWNRAWPYFQPVALTNTAIISDYANAICQGMQSGLPAEAGKMKAARGRTLPKHL